MAEIEERLETLDPIRRGDDRQVKIVATHPEAIPDQDIEAGAPFYLDGAELFFTAKYNTSYSDAEAVFQKTSDDGITVRAAPDNHIADVEIAAEDTEDMPKGKTLICDFQVMGEKTLTIWKGYLPVYDDVTRAT